MWRGGETEEGRRKQVQYRRNSGSQNEFGNTKTRIGREEEKGEG